LYGILDDALDSSKVDDTLDSPNKGIFWPFIQSPK